MIAHRLLDHVRTQPRSRLLGAVVLGGVVVWAALRSVSWTVAHDLAYLDPPAALSVRADHPMALGAVAEFNWALGRHRFANELAARASAANPLNGAGYRVLGLVAAAQGDDAKAERLVRLALQRTPGDLMARRWLADRAQAAGRWSEALALQDRILRQSPDEGLAWFEEWTARLAEPAVRAAMLPVLAPVAEEPPVWREAFLTHYAANATESASVDAMFAAMRRLSPGETTVWLSRLVADGRWDEAYARWRERSMAPVSDGRASEASVGSVHGSVAESAAGPVAGTGHGIVNGGFETEPGLPPFDWTLLAPSGVQVTRAPVAGHGGQALRVQFLGTRAAFNGVQQTVLLAPGPHLLHWAYQLEGLTTPRGLRWVAVCAGSGSVGQELGASPLMAGQSAWREAQFAFEVPAGCPAVTLRLELAARIAAETQAYGTAWFDDLRLEPRTASQ